MTTAINPIEQRLKQARKQRAWRWYRVVGFLLILVIALLLLTLSVGQSITPLSEVVAVILGEQVPGASFVVGQLRLPRVLVALLVGTSFGLAGAAFQIMLRNPLASPDIIGVSSGASAAAVFAIIMLNMSGGSVAVFSIFAGLMVTLTVFGLSFKHGAAGTRLILVGIGMAAMLESVIAYLLSQAQSWDLQEAMRWLTGSVNSAQLTQVPLLCISVAVFGSLLLSRSKDLEVLRTGDETAQALGVRVNQTRLVIMLSAVGLIAVGVATTGPIAFVAFLSGPIAVRLIGNTGSALLPAGLIGACLVMGGDYIGQFLLPNRYPVGVVTGALGAPYLIYLMIRTNRKGGSL